MAPLAGLWNSERAVSLLAGVFLIFYGFGLVGRPWDVARGVRSLERLSPRTRKGIGVVLIAAGAFLIITSLLGPR